MVVVVGRGICPGQNKHSKNNTGLYNSSILRVVQLKADNMLDCWRSKHKCNFLDCTLEPCTHLLYVTHKLEH